jgi:hypothetical protein
MKNLLITGLLLLFVSLSKAQTFNTYYAEVVANISESNLLSDLTTFEKFGIKTVGSPALTHTENWISHRYESMGYTDVVLQPFTYRKGSSNNIIVTKTGTIYPYTFLIIDAHYDTINGPGTNDNGTGTVLLLEMARLLKDVETEYSIKFIHFSGEEDGLIGSKFYVKNTVVPENMDIKLVFNIDEVGGVSGLTNDTVVCEQDLGAPTFNNAASSAATESLAILMGLYSTLNTQISKTYGSDYMPFENNGEIITGLYEKNISPVNHSANDNLENMDVGYFYEVVRGAIGAAMEFAVAYETSSLVEQKYYERILKIYPDPSNSYLNIEFDEPLEDEVEFKLMDRLGKEIYTKTISEQNFRFATDFIASDTYEAVFKMGNKRFVKTVVVE